MEQKYVKVSELSKIMGIASTTIYKWLRRGLLTAVKMTDAKNGNIYISVEELEKTFVGYRELMERRKK